MDNKYKENLIDRFLQGELTPEEQSVFDKLLQEDAEFKSEVDITYHIATGIEKKGETAARHEIEALSSKKEFEQIISEAEKKHRRKPQTALFYFVAITAACIISVFIYIGLQPQYTAKALFDEYYSIIPYEPIPVRGGQLLSVKQRDMKIQAIDLYTKGEYAQASILFNHLNTEIETGEVPEDILFFGGLCFMELKEYDKAISIFDKLFKDGIYFNEKGGWYLALCYLKKGKQDDARRILFKLIEEETDYVSKSKELLNKLDKRKFLNSYGLLSTIYHGNTRQLK